MTPRKPSPDVEPDAVDPDTAVDPDAVQAIVDEATAEITQLAEDAGVEETVTVEVTEAPVAGADPSPAELEAELAVQLQKTGDDRDQARIDELLAALGPPPSQAAPTDTVPQPPASAGPQVDGPIFMQVAEGVKVGDIVVTGGVGYEVVSGPDGTTVAVDETGAVTKIL